MSKRIKNVNTMLAQLARLQEQLRGMREMIEDEIGRGVTKLFLAGAGAEEIYNFVEKIVAGSGYLDYVKLRREKEGRKRKEKVGQGEAKGEEAAGDSFWP